MILTGKKDSPLRFLIAGGICLPFTDEIVSLVNNIRKMLIIHCYYAD
jgi:hypothetical protein